jgi:hypothetical protein
MNNINKLEDLLNQEGLIAPIEYDEKSKSSFINAVVSWSKERNTKVNEVTIGLKEGFKKAKHGYITAKNNLKIIREEYKIADEKDLAELRNLAFSEFHQEHGNIAQMILMPFLGRWSYNSTERTVYRSSNLKRKIVIGSLIDPLIHEYLHAYEHLLYDQLDEQGLIKEGYQNPAGIVEPAGVGFVLRPPSYKQLKKFENKIIKTLISFE